MTTSFRPSPLFQFANKTVTPFIRLGFPIGLRRSPMALLTVPGRKTGVARTTPVALERRGDGWLLVAVFGVCDWSRNLEASDTAVITIRGKTTAVTARRLGPEEGGPVLREAMLEAPRFIRSMTAPYFAADHQSPPHVWEEETMAHPVFILTPA